MAAILGLTANGAAWAGPSSLTVIETVTASGTIDGLPFTDQTLTFEAEGFGAASNHRPLSYADYRLNLATVTVSGELDGATPFSASFTDPSSYYVFDNQNPSALNAGIAVSFYDLMDTSNASFGAYALAGNIGPLTGDVLTTTNQAFGTNIGDFILTGTSGEATFTASFTPASSVPEPAIWSMIMLGAAAVGVQMRRRRAPVIA